MSHILVFIHYVCYNHSAQLGRTYAGMMELVDMRDLGSRASGVGVRVPMPAPSPYGITTTMIP